MTVTSDENKITYVGNGVTKDFSVPFYFINDTDIKVSVNDGISTTDLIINQDYTLTGAGEQNGGSITVNTAIPTGVKLLILREVPFFQNLDIPENDRFPSQNMERALDRLTMQTQQLKEQVDRAVTVDIFSDTDPSGLIGEIETIYNIRDEVVTVAENSSRIKTCSESIASIIDAPNQANSARNSAIEATNSAVTAQLMSDLASESATAASASAGAAEQSAAQAGESAAQAVAALSLQIGDIGTALYVDETTWLRRRLNGQVIAINEHTTDFLNYLKGVQTTSPSLFTTESNWQSEKALSKLGQCGRFVIDETAGTIRLPAVVNTQGLTDLSVIGTIKSESLPNVSTNTGTNVKITGMGTAGASSGAGALYVVNHSVTTGNTMGSANAVGYDTWYLNLSRSNSTYQDGAPVQQEAIQYPYFIQINTGSETTSDITNEQVLNNPYTLFDSKYTDAPLYNSSWIVSNGTYHSGSAYVKAYEGLLVEANADVTAGTTVTLPGGTSYTKRGLSVKEYGDATITDYDFVVNTSDNTFRLPVKTLTASGSRVVGNGMTLGLTDSVNNGGLFATSTSPNPIKMMTGVYGSDVGVAASGVVFSSDKGIGVTTDPTKSGIETSSKDIYLYFYVGETVQNANLIDAGRLADGLANVIPNNSDLIAGYSMPSSQYVDLMLGASDSAYTAPANGWFSLIVQGLTYLDMHKSGTSSFGLISNPASGWARQFVPVLKGETIAVYYTGTPAASTFRFYYSEGSK